MSKFKVGDKIVCVNNLSFECFNLEFMLELYNIYTVSSILKPNFLLIEETNIIFKDDRFISLKEFRKQKLNKIFENE
jgi:hypothetical protein